MPSDKTIVAFASRKTGSYPTFERTILPILRPHATTLLSSTREELYQAVWHAYTLKPDIFITNCGDGGWHEIITAMIWWSRQLGVPVPKNLMLPMGTMNIGESSLNDRSGNFSCTSIS
ncbi:MAG: hypothetical protein U9Q03_02120 [Patescibacteria group bacterium]|nr:hypothetical protein [Patescibacteria group bacterium]